MHEVGIAEQILALALETARREQATSVVRVRVQVGAISGVVEEALRFAFEALAEGTPAAGARLDIEPVGVRCYCATCEQEFEAAPLNYVCPACGTPSGDIRQGRELRVSEIEVA